MRLTVHLRQRSHCTPRKLSGWDWGGDKMHRTWGVCTHQAPGHLSCLDLGKARNTDPTESVPLWSTQEPEPEQVRPGKCTKCRAHFGQFPWRATGAWPGKCTPSWAGANPVWSIHCKQSPHMQCLFAVFLPPHSTTEKVSLNKWPPGPPCVRVEIRHWRDLQTEEAKINKEEGTALEVTGATDKNPVVSTD